MSLLALLLAATPQALVAGEDAYYAVDHLTPPDGARLEVGGLDFLPDGRLILSTRRGQVWIVTDPLAQDPADAHFELFAEGLWEGLGLTIHEGQIYVLQRGELSRLSDVDGDGTCDLIETIADDWGLSGHYHEFAFGLPIDSAGNFYVTLNVSFPDPTWWHGQSTVPYRGWALRISPDGAVTPFAHGLRSPAGVSLSPDGRLFVTDNQGDWMAASPIFHVEEGGFYGHPASLDWTEAYRSSHSTTSLTVPAAEAESKRKPAAVWLPYKWSRSPGDQVWDETGGAFGSFRGQFFLAELTNGMILRGDFETVRDGLVQGWVIPFRQGVGSSVRIRFASDGTLFCGLTNRGWGGLSPADGIARVRWTGETPFEIADVELLDPEAPDVKGNGFRITFTHDLAESPEDGFDSIQILQYDYDYWWEYGSPERHMREVDVDGVDMTWSYNEGPRSILLYAGLEPGFVTRVRMPDIRSKDGRPLLHDEFAYTINQLPSGPVTRKHVTNIVPPPPGKEMADAGWLRLTHGDATNSWTFEDWALVDASLDPDDPTRFVTRDGNGALVNLSTTDASHYVSKPSFGDAEVKFDFMLPADGRSSVFLAGSYEIALADTTPAGDRTPRHCGGVLPGPDTEGLAPINHAYNGSGAWHSFHAVFRAARFGDDGAKLEPARLRSLTIDGTLEHEDVVLAGPSSDAPFPETAHGPIVFRGDLGTVALRDVRAKPLEDSNPTDDTPANPLGSGLNETGWTRLFDGETLDGWRINEDGYWLVEDDVILGEGPRSHLFSPRDDYVDFEVYARLKIAEGGNSGLYFRTAYTDEGWPAGYEAQVNSSFADGQRTGSLYGFSGVSTQLVAADTWFDYYVLCREEADGTRIRIAINGVVVTDVLETERRYERGHIALQQHHDGSVVECAELWIREL
jgi:glucose/arabinose dehydrogenase